MHLSKPVIYCRKPWHGHRQTCAPANNPSAQTAQQILSSARKSLFCHIKTPTLLLMPQVSGGLMGQCSPSGHLRVSVSAGAKLSCDPALRGSRGVQVGLSLAYIFLHYQVCVFKSSILRCVQKKNNTAPLVCSGSLL